MFEENIEYISFISNANRLKLLFQKWGKRKSEERSRYIETFHPKIYKKLSGDKKNEHSFDNCESCEKHFSEMQSILELNFKSSIHKKTTVKENVFAAAKSCSSSSFKAKTLKENTMEIYKVINQPFEKKCGISFAESITSLKELSIVKKCTKYQKKKEKRKIVKEVTQKIEKDWESDAVERFVNITYIYF